MNTGDPSILIESPVAATLLAVALVALVAPLAMKRLRNLAGTDDG